MCSPAAVETHASVLIFLGDRVYKSKKAVNLGFLDLRTVAARRATLESELQLNRRLSPDVYLEVADFVSAEVGREPVLCMRRLPAERRLATLIRQGSCTEHDVRGIARILAGFHRSCDAVPDASPVGSAAALGSLWQDAWAVLERHAELFPPDALPEMRRLAVEFLDGRGALLNARREAGRIRDGHGDLLADDIFLLPDGVRILDCLEFDASLRCGDTLLDAAFLAMDIERCGSPSLARAFLDEYRTSAQDDAPASLAHHYIAYRAAVRAKVALLRLEQGAGAAAEDARSLVALALTHLRQGQVRLIVVSGLPATGKSTLADLVHRNDSTSRSCLVLHSDVLRDEVAPAQHTEDGIVGTGRYSPSRRADVYRVMFERAAGVLHAGVDVILDATFADEWTRAAVEELAGNCSARLIVLSCVVPAEVARRRLAARVRGADAGSEADELVYRHLADSTSTWAAARPVDTSIGAQDAYEQISRLLR